MATSSVDGLISGLSTSDLISQLMQAEAAGQTRIKQKITTQQSAITSLQNVNSRVSALKTAVGTVLDASSWQAVTTTSSSSAVTVSASSGAPTGKLILDVKELAQVGVKTSTVSPTGSIQDGTGLSITIGGTTTPITVTTDTAQGVADAINAAGAGVSAALVSTEQGTTVLQLTGTKTGVANDFTVSGLTTTFTTVVPAADAKIGVGTVGAGGYTVTSSTNTFTNLLPNVSITANQVQSDVTISVGTDTDAIASKVQAMVTAANGLLSEISTQSSISVNNTTTSAKPLAADPLVRQLSQDVLSAVSNGLSGYGSFSQLGIQTDKTGKLTFDKDAFVAAYTADPAKAKSAITGGLATTLNTLSTSANASITSAIQSGDSIVRSLNDQVDEWDIRLQARQEALQKQFANMEVALGKLQDQSNWLAGQIASLG